MESKVVKLENSPRLMFLMDALAYLEKQKEQKAAEWSEMDKLHQHNIISYLEFRKDKNLPEDSKYPVLDVWIDWLKSLRPKPHWKPSEEQMKTLKCLPGVLRDFKLDTSAQMLEVLYEQLKKL